MADTAVANACPDLITDVVLPACSPLKAGHVKTDPAPCSEQLHDKVGSPKPESNGDVANGHATNGDQHAQPGDGEVKDHTDGTHSSKCAHEAKSESSPKPKEDSAAPDESELAKPVEPSNDDSSSKPEEASDKSAKSEETVEQDEPAKAEDSANPEEQAAVSLEHKVSTDNPEASPKPDHVPAATSPEDSPKLVDVATPAKPNEAKTDASKDEGESEKPKDSEAEEGKIESPEEEKSKASP
jgi:hypothetical protein